MIVVREDEGRARLAVPLVVRGPLNPHLLQLAALAGEAPGLGLVRRAPVPKGGDCAGGGEAQALKSRAAGPAAGPGLGACVRQMGCVQGALGGDVYSLESVP